MSSTGVMVLEVFEVFFFYTHPLAILDFVLQHRARYFGLVVCMEALVVYRMREVVYKAYTLKFVQI